MIMLFGVAAILVVTASVASGAKQPHALVRCKPGNVTPTCVFNVSASQISAKCKKAGTNVVVPTISITATAGIKSATITLVNNGKVIKKVTYKKPGPLSKKIKGLKISTKGFKHGVFTLKIHVVDQRGHSKTLTRRFAICKPVPVFTG
jgi:hypothetical protein